MFISVAFLVLFFFKQKTAYEIGLGIPAEPLFRSKKPPPVAFTHAYSIVIGSKHITLNATGGGFLTASKQFRHGATSRSEERRVGKECRSRWSPCHKKKNKKIDEVV